MAIASSSKILVGTDTGNFLGLEGRGRIRAGNVADLIILKSNPLDDIRNTRDIDSVILKGRLLDSAKLECLRSRSLCM